MSCNSTVQSWCGECWVAPPPQTNVKIRVTYLDATPDFVVPLDGTTRVMQADVRLAVENYDVTLIDKLIIGDGMINFENQSFNIYVIPELEFFNSDIEFPNTVERFSDYCFSYLTNFNKILSVPASVTFINKETFNTLYVYNQDMVFEHIDTIPTFYYGTIWTDWKNYYPARITTPNSTKTNSEWKSAMAPAYQSGDIESINGVLWNDIP